jgi:hypothetical protein
LCVFYFSHTAASFTGACGVIIALDLSEKGDSVPQASTSERRASFSKSRSISLQVMGEDSVVVSFDSAGASKKAEPKKPTTGELRCA